MSGSLWLLIWVLSRRESLHKGADTGELGQCYLSLLGGLLLPFPS